MKSTLLAILVLACVFSPCMAQTKPPATHNGEIDLGGSYSNTEKGGKAGNATFSMLAPLESVLESSYVSASS